MLGGNPHLPIILLKIKFIMSAGSKTLLIGPANKEEKKITIKIEREEIKIYLQKYSKLYNAIIHQNRRAGQNQVWERE